MEVNVPFALLLTTLAGLSTGIGSVIAYFIRRPKHTHLAVMLGFSAGVMIYISFTELLKTAIDEVGFATANLGFFIGIIFIAILDILIPHEYEVERSKNIQTTVDKDSGSKRKYNGQLPSLSGSDKNSKLMRTGIFVALGIAIHNFPEGFVTFSSAATGDLSLGVAIAIAIAIHNIPEGISVSVPILYASGSRRRAFLYSFSAGLAEPVGGLIGYAIVLPFLTPALLSTLLAFTAGIMVYISLDELLPLAHRYGEEHLVIIGIGAGMLVMAVSLILLP